ncbi:MAG: hypothetical protein LBC30_03870, partial [Puniceicoccales bacterium]|nr:hypothetical protein [Puniceicoccales bacterium]
MRTVVASLPPKEVQNEQGSPTTKTRISRKNASVAIATEEKSNNFNLNERHIVSPQGYVPNTAQREGICELTQQIITKICSLADGMSLILDAGGFEITKNILDLLSNITRFLLPKSNHSFKAYIYNVRTEKTDIVFKRLILAISSTCKVILRFAPQHLQIPLKLLPQVSLLLDVTEVLINY